MGNHAIIGFNSGVLSPKIDTRFDVEKYQRGCRILQNMIATKYGSAEKRSGMKHISASYQSKTIARMLGFIYSASVAYKIEMVDRAFRFYYSDAVLEDTTGDEVVITTPYEEADLFQIQHAQIGDVMWLVHPSQAQRKLSRTDPYTFELEEIDFRKGPFLLRNDLVDLANPSTATLRCTVTEAGQYGSLISSNAVFQQGHKGALYKLVHPRADTIIEQSGDGTSDVLSGKGTFTAVSRGTWTGTFYVQRSENNADWENFRSYKGNDNRNIIESWTEEEDNVDFRITTEAGMDADFRCDISIKDGQDYGIVKVIGVGDSFNSIIEVYKELVSTDATTRWAEGAWSGVRGFPSAITFYEDRCVYAGAATGAEGDEAQEDDYPSLINLTF